ncbi:MAG: hypothetical protein LBM13_05210 [Candidatus Ancillula sp.]|jgi:hypothetical protein|nr:hypothetical protein [Candidatus Ancillula sp.]
MNFSEFPEFSKDIKRLGKKWKTLSKDLQITQIALTSLYDFDQENIEEIRANFFDGHAATILKKTADFELVKMRMNCMSPGAKNKVRLVFTYVKIKDTITFIELYSKNDKPREDEWRIKNFLEDRGLR